MVLEGKINWVAPFTRGPNGTSYTSQNNEVRKEVRLSLRFQRIKRTPFMMYMSSKITSFEILILDWNGSMSNSSMDMDNDYYSCRCKDINGLWLFKGTFRPF